MDNENILTSKQVVRDLLGNFLLWQIILQFCYFVVSSIVLKKINSNILILVFSVILQAIVIYFVWKIAIKKTLQQKTILYTDIDLIMKNLFIFTIIICIVTIIINFSILNSSVNDAILQENIKYKAVGEYVNEHFDQDFTDRYYEQVATATTEAKNSIYKYAVISNFFVVVSYIAILPLVRKQLLFYIDRKLVISR